MPLELTLSDFQDFVLYGAIAPRFDADGGSFQAGSAVENDHFLRQPLSSLQFDLAAECLFEKIVEAVRRIIATEHFSVALSGGADSRLILSILATHFPDRLAEFDFYTVAHPQLLETDRDVLIARQLARHLDLPHEVRVNRRFSQAYIHPSLTQSKILCGLWGGELLGGQLLQNRLFYADSLRKDEKSPLGEFVRRFLGGVVIDPRAEFFLHFVVLASSPLTAFYRSINWINPRRPLQFASTPFLDEHFLNILFSLPFDFLRDYRIYSTILKKFAKDLLFVEVNNQMLPEDSLLRRARLGVEAKKIPVVNEIPVTRSWQQPLDELLRQLEKGPYSEYLSSIFKYLEFNLVEAS